MESVVVIDKEYVGQVKIYNTGLKEDPVPGEKRGKGVQFLNSSYWLSALGVFIARDLTHLQAFLAFAEKQVSEMSLRGDFIFLMNQSNMLFMKSENEALRTQNSKDLFLMASLLALVAAECDDYPYARYTAEERKKHKERMFKNYREAIPIKTQDHDSSNSYWPTQDELGKYWCEPSRVDLIPTTALERLGLHNELCAIKWQDNAEHWKKEGFFLSKRISSIKRHFDGVHSRDHSEDHISHLVWNFMAVYHVNETRPDLNDLTNYEDIKKKSQLS